MKCDKIIVIMINYDPPLKCLSGDNFMMPYYPPIGTSGMKLSAIHGSTLPKNPLLGLSFVRIKSETSPPLLICYYYSDDSPIGVSSSSYIIFKKTSSIGNISYPWLHYMVYPWNYIQTLKMSPL